MLIVIRNLKIDPGFDRNVQKLSCKTAEKDLFSRKIQQNLFISIRADTSIFPTLEVVLHYLFTQS